MGIHDNLLFYPVGCAQTAAVGDPRVVVGLLLFLCSYVCQVADPSVTLNLKDLRVDGLVPRLSFPGWSEAPD